MASTKKDRIILGCMTFGPADSETARVHSVEECRKFLQYFHDAGYDEIDTARGYTSGKQEAFTAQAGYKDFGFKIATKIYPHGPITHRPESLRATLDKSLSELKTEKIDIWYLHAPDRSTPFEETLKECNNLHKEGKFDKLGLSNYTAFEVAEICTLCRERGWVVPSIYQAMYNAVTRAIEKELVIACRRYGLDIVIYNPLAGGLLTGKNKDMSIPDSGRFSLGTGAQGNSYRTRYFKKPFFDSLAIIDEACKAHDVTMAETALRWCVHHSDLKIKDGTDGIIIGVSSVKHLEQNIADLEKGPLPQDLLDKLDQAWDVVKADVPPYWHGKLEYTYPWSK